MFNRLLKSPTQENNMPPAINGKLPHYPRVPESQEPQETYVETAISFRLKWVMWGQIFVLGMFMMTTLVLGCVIVPGMREVAATIKGERENELSRLKMLDDARAKQVVQEATILMHQQEIDRLQKAMIKRAN